MTDRADNMKYLVYLGILILLVQIIIGIGIYLSFDNWSTRGTFGDMFGAVSALFSGLALAGVVYAILLQRVDLDIQMKELVESRKAQARSAEAQELSSRLLGDQIRLAQESLEHQIRKDRGELEPRIISIDSRAHRPNRADVQVKAEFIFLNRGEPIRNLKIIGNPSRVDIDVTPKDIVEPGEEYIISILYDPRESQELSFKFQLEDNLNIVHTWLYEFDHRDNVLKKIT